MTVMNGGDNSQFEVRSNATVTSTVDSVTCKNMIDQLACRTEMYTEKKSTPSWLVLNSGWLIRPTLTSAPGPAACYSQDQTMMLLLTNDDDDEADDGNDNDDDG